MVVKCRVAVATHLQLFMPPLTSEGKLKLIMETNKNTIRRFTKQEIKEHAQLSHKPIQTSSQNAPLLSEEHLDVGWDRSQG